MGVLIVSFYLLKTLQPVKAVLNVTLECSPLPFSKSFYVDFFISQTLLQHFIITKFSMDQGLQPVSFPLAFHHVQVYQDDLQPLEFYKQLEERLQKFHHEV